MSMARNNSRDSKRYYEWLDYSECDIIAANDLKSNERTYPAAAFHCQQSMEKALKAYFLYTCGYAPDGHNIIFLCRRLAKTDGDFSKWIDECVETNNYYIQTRYPPDLPLLLDRKKLDALIDDALELYTFIIRKINELSKDGE